jgi:DNA-binding winged helix-turn-helix (wHTH) protein
MMVAELAVFPADRVIRGPAGSAPLEPLVMALFLCLAGRTGTLVSRRELFSRLWGAVSVGDDNLNRLVAALRRALISVGASSVRVETVPASGYILRLAALPTGADAGEQAAQALAEGFDSWRLGLPEPDYLRIALLSQAGEIAPDNARIFGLLALLHRHGAEYAPPEEAAGHVRSCELAARRALQIEPGQVEAASALASIAPLYGAWSERSRHLAELCAASGRNLVPEDDLAVLEMATGQIRASKRRRDRLIKMDPLAAIFSYKSVYQHWSVGDATGMDHIADRAMQLWPFHPAIWTARFWTLAFTNRLAAAQALIGRRSPRGIPVQMLAFLERMLAAAAGSNACSADECTAAAVRLAGQGPAQAVAALFTLGLLGRPKDAFEVAERYYLQQGAQPVPLQPGADHPMLNEQHRRLTQILFTPACAEMRENPRFLDLCRSVGLTSFWEQTGTTPDQLG